MSILCQRHMDRSHIDLRQKIFQTIDKSYPFREFFPVSVIIVSKDFHLESKMSDLRHFKTNGTNPQDAYRLIFGFVSRYHITAFPVALFQCLIKRNYLFQATEHQRNRLLRYRINIAIACQGYRDSLFISCRQINIVIANPITGYYFQILTCTDDIRCIFFCPGDDCINLTDSFFQTLRISILLNHQFIISVFKELSSNWIKCFGYQHFVHSRTPRFLIGIKGYRQ